MWSRLAARDPGPCSLLSQWPHAPQILGYVTRQEGKSKYKELPASFFTEFLLNNPLLDKFKECLNIMQIIQVLK